MNIRPLHRAIVLAIAAPFALVACGGGGGGVMRSSPAPQRPPATAPPTTPSPPAAPATLCPMPITSDCVVTTKGVILDERESAHALVVRTGGDSLGLVGTTYRFSNGTRIETGRLAVGSGSAGSTSYYNPGTVLHSSVTVEAGAALSVSGRVVGDVVNRGSTALFGTIEGNLNNDAITAVYFDLYDAKIARVLGSFTQSPAGTLMVMLPPGHISSTPLFTVTGQAVLGGTLELRNYEDAWGPYPLPSAGAHLILHADGGLFGSFDRWTSPGLFIEGSLRYGSHDVWFDLARVSVQAAMAGQGFGGITLASAGNLDRALASTDRLRSMAAPPTPSQSRFLHSAARLLWLDDAQQAARSLDSLAGHGHALLAEAQTVLAGQAGNAIASRTMQLRPGEAGHWSQALPYQGAGASSDGYDRWLGPHLLVGGHLSEGANTLGFAQLGGHASGHDRLASLYLHHRGDRWLATAVGLAGRSQRLLQRPIDLADGHQHLATAQRSLSLAGLHGEIARLPLPVAGGSLQPFAALDYAVLRSAAFEEAGDTGFELHAPASFMQQLDASLGARYAREWRLGNAWWGLRAEWVASWPLARQGATDAAFAGAPETLFDLGTLEPSGLAHATRLGVDGRIGNEWRWSLLGARSSDRRQRDTWQLWMARKF